MSCEELFKTGFYDYWVVSHTILPFALTTLGFVEPLLVMVLVYLWESVELLIRDCTSVDSAWSHPESRINSQVVDPACGFLGIVVALSLARAWGVDPRADAAKHPLVRGIFLAAVLSPSFLFFDWFYNRDLHHLFPVAMVGALVVSRTVERHLSWYDATLYVYVTLLHLVVTLADKTNSFVVALGVSLGVAVGAQACRQILRNDSAVAP